MLWGENRQTTMENNIQYSKTVQYRKKIAKNLRGRERPGKKREDKLWKEVKVWLRDAENKETVDDEI